MRRFWKLFLAAGAVLAAFTITFFVGENGVDIDIDTSPRAQAARNREPWDLRDLKVLNRTILELKDSYVEPERIDADRMLLAGLNAIQRSVAPVLVHYEEGDPELAVQVNDERRSFGVSDVEALWELANRYREIFAFLQENLDEEEVELRDVEYAAVNGMLRVLDPHTVLLTPEVYDEMRTNTRGEFGGLGIVISIRDGQLTVIRPMEDTPASRAGLLRGDRIVQIEDETTLNMPLTEAVTRLRGPPGSKVTVFVVRPGSFERPRRFELTRAVIHIESVESRMLDDGIGYVALRSFQGNTFDDMQRALADLRGDGMKGLVLDLRDNPGGLLDQAVRVSDAFLSSGTIVTTSSRDPRQRDEKYARPDGTEPPYPMVVLVNGGSASASEIVAGALKSHDRAVVIGQQTFGKGSVQVLYDFPDGSALKLTIAQYLTPGEVSIQGVGIVPDLAITPMTVDRQDIDLQGDDGYLRESDLSRALTNEKARADARPKQVLRYYLPKDTRERLRTAAPEDQEENEFEDEFLTEFSRTLLASADSADRRVILERASEVIGRVQAEEMDRAVKELRQLGIDWSEGTDAGPSEVDVRVQTNRPNDRGKAGEPFELQVTVTNRGANPLYQLRAKTKSDYRLFDGRELVFGKLAPGQTRTWSTTLGVCGMDDDDDGEADAKDCRLPRDVPDRADGIVVQFEEAHGNAPGDVEVRTRIEGLERPQFAYALQLADDVEGNGDGRLQRGEKASIYLRVRNVGEGRTYASQANLRNLSHNGVLLRAGRFELDTLEPGDEEVIRFTFDVLPEFDKDVVKLEVSIADVTLREAVTERIELPVADPGPSPTPKDESVVVREGGAVFAAPDDESELVGKVVGRNGLRLPATAELEGYLRVDLGDGRPGWVPKAAVTQGGAGGGQLAWHVNHMPPDLTVDHGGSLVVRSPSIQLDVEATDETRVQDLYVFVGAQKVFYQSNRSGSSPRQASFEERIPLRPGINYVTVYARESDDIVSRELFVVRRDGPNGELLDTPELDDAFQFFHDATD
ncbi:MAG TPA: MXAN_5808 family serine peptidase [Polyangiaceae bacterium LLY-WYZ-14_1]|nr:MXAN_5808 family serine peptidase [Polyangiaceae bacterium LLY-WYZ-14_1]